MTVTFASPTESSLKLPSGEYIMKLENIDEEESTYRPGEKRLKFIFDVQSVESVDEYPADIDEDDDDAVGEYEADLIGKKHWAWCSNKMGGNATLRRWLSGMLGRTIEKNDNLAPDQFIGKSYKVTLGMVPYTFDGKPGEKFDIALIKPHKVKRDRTTKPKTNEENLAPWEREDDDE